MRMFCQSSLQAHLTIDDVKKHFSAAAAVLLATLAGCAVQAAPPGAATATLTATAPSARLALAAPPPRDALLEIDVAEVGNPGLAPVVVEVALQDDRAEGPAVPVTEFALFPADRPGRFIARADAALEQLAAALGRRPERVRLQVALRVERAPSAAAAPVTLRVSARWVHPDAVR